MTRVFIAAASPIVRAGLEAVLRANPSLTVVASAALGATLAQQVEEAQPDVILLKLEWDEDEGLPPPVLALGAGADGGAVVVLTDQVNPAWAAEALRSGVRAVLPREATAGEIVAAVEAAATGLVVLHPSMIDPLLPAPAPHARALPTSQSQALTPREIEVLGMMAEGLGNKTIAWRLGISEHTVKFHIASIFSKLHAGSRTEAVTLGIRQGLIMI